MTNRQLHALAQVLLIASEDHGGSVGTNHIVDGIFDELDLNEDIDGDPIAFIAVALNDIAAAIRENTAAVSSHTELMMGLRGYVFEPKEGK